MTAAPTQVLRSPLAAPPARAFDRIAHSAFIADYLQAALPPVVLATGCQLHGHDRAGRPLTLTVTAAQAPQRLSIALDDAAGPSRLHFCLAPSDAGSCLTVLHEPATTAEPGADDAAADALAGALASEPPPALRADRIGSDAALAEARAYLHGTLAAMQQLLRSMAPRQGYAKPAPDRFSLVEQVWHLADVEEFGWAQRFARLADGARPVLPGVDGDRLAIERCYQRRPWRGAARRFIAQRRRTLRALARLDAAALARTVIFSGAPSDGARMLAALVAHDHEHRLDMAELWRAVR